MWDHLKRRTVFTCVACGKRFELQNCVARRRADHACSLSCARAAWPNRRQERVTLECERCKAPFEVAKGRAGGGNKPKARFCSKACKDATLKGRTHPNFIDGRAEARREARKVIAKRIFEEGKCEECGSTDRLHGHHIKHFATHPDLRNEPSNIQVLCAVCHAAKHPNQANHLFRGNGHSGEMRNCPICARPFYTKPSHIGRKKTCGTAECRAAFRRQKAG